MTKKLQFENFPVKKSQTKMLIVDIVYFFHQAACKIIFIIYKIFLKPVKNFVKILPFEIQTLKFEK